MVKASLFYTIFFVIFSRGKDAALSLFIFTKYILIFFIDLSFFSISLYQDFAFVAQAVPSTFFFLGQGSGGDEAHHIPSTDYGLHHPKFALDESVMSTGVELHVNLAVRALKYLANSNDEMASEL